MLFFFSSISETVPDIYGSELVQVAYKEKLLTKSDLEQVFGSSKKADDVLNGRYPFEQWTVKQIYRVIEAAPNSTISLLPSFQKLTPLV